MTTKKVCRSCDAELEGHAACWSCGVPCKGDAPTAAPAKASAKKSGKKTSAKKKRAAKK